MIKKNETLKVLDLSMKMTSEGINMVINTLCDNSTLQTLKIASHAEFNYTTVGQVLKENKTLKDLELLYYPDTACDGTCTIANALCTNSTLISLNICGNKVNRVQDFVQMLNVNRTLTELNICWCGITAQGACMIAGVLCENSTVQTLDIRFNPIGLCGAEAFAAMLCKNRTVIKLSILDCEEQGIDSWFGQAYVLNDSLAYNDTISELYLFGSSHYEEDLSLMQIVRIKEFELKELKDQRLTVDITIKEMKEDDIHI